MKSKLLLLLTILTIFTSCLHAEQLLKSRQVEGISSFSKETYTSTAGQTTFDLVNPYKIAGHKLLVYVNGVYQSETLYSQASPTRIIFNDGLLADWKVDFVNYSEASKVTTKEFDTTAGQQTFTLTTPIYDNVQVYVNGIWQDPTSYTINSSYSVTIGTPRGASETVTFITN